MDYLSLQDPSSDDDSRLSDQDSLDYQELEVALYSQIHFETNEDCEDQDFIDPDCNKYELKVEGNSKTGFLSYKSTPDIILNDELTDKYEDGVCDNSVIYVCDSQNQRVLDISRNDLEDTLDNSKEEHSFGKNTDKSNEKDNQTKIKKKEKKKSSLAEELILGVGDSDRSDIEAISSGEETSGKEIEIISDNDTDFVSKKSVTSINQKTKRLGYFIEDSDDSDVGDLYIGTNDNLEKQSDILCNVDWGVKLPSDSSDQESVNEEDWKISYADTKSFNPNRYFKPVVCYNCKEKGHTSKTCQKPKRKVVCILCSEEGHISRNCPESFCPKCLEIGHNGKDCRHNRNQQYIKCHRCKMEGHEAKRCPDEWRQYHLTIKPGKLVKGRPRKDVPVSCYNCGEDDHFGHECQEEKANRFVRFTTPFICVYRQHNLYEDSVKADVFERDVENFKHPFKKQKKEHISAKKNTKSLVGNDHLKHNNYLDSVQSPGIPFKKPKNVSLFVPFGKESSKSKTSERNNPEVFQKSCQENSIIVIPDDDKISTGLELNDSLGKMNRKKDKMMKKKYGNSYKQNMGIDHRESFITSGMVVPEWKRKEGRKNYPPKDGNLYTGVSNQDGQMIRNKDIQYDQLSYHQQSKKKKKQNLNKLIRNCVDSSMTKLKDTEKTDEIPSNTRGFKTNLSYENITLNMENSSFPVNYGGFKTKLNYKILSKNRGRIDNLQITVGNRKPREIEKNDLTATSSNARMFQRNKQKRRNKKRKLNNIQS